MCASSLQTPRLRLISLKPHLRLISLKPRLRPGYIKRQSGMICCNTSASTICFNSHASPAPATRLCDHARNITAAPKADRSMYLICSFIKCIFWFCSFFHKQTRTNKKRPASSCWSRLFWDAVCAIFMRSQQLCDHRIFTITERAQRDISRRGGCAPCVRAVPAHAG